MEGAYFNLKYFARKFFNRQGQESKNPKRRVLPEDEKLEFVRTSVSFIEGKEIMDSCFILNFGYEKSLPWPQVLSVLNPNSLDVMKNKCYL